MKRPSTYTIVTPETFGEWRTAHNADSNLIALYVTTCRNLYRDLECLANACCKQFKRHGGLDLGYLSEFATLKAITRAGRKEVFRYDGITPTMEKDRQAREYLAAWIFEYCQATLS